MQAEAELETLEQVEFDNELAVRRTRRMIEFMGVLCENERRVLHASEKSSATALERMGHEPTMGSR